MKGMNKHNLLSHIDNLFSECLELVKRKSADYASDADALSNFHYTAELSGVTPPEQMLVFIAMKISRLKELISNEKTPNNESISDSIKDCINYLALLDVALFEEIRLE